jgi:hypothetical protein
MQGRKEEKKKTIGSRFNPQAQEDVFDHGVFLMPSEL